MFYLLGFLQCVIPVSKFSAKVQRPVNQPYRYWVGYSHWPCAIHPKVTTVSPLKVIVNHPCRPYLHTQTHSITRAHTHAVPTTWTPDPAACLGLSSHKTGCPPLERFSSHNSEGQDGKLYLPLHPCQLLLLFWSIFLYFLLSFFPNTSSGIMTRHVTFDNLPWCCWRACVPVVELVV